MDIPKGELNSRRDFFQHITNYFIMGGDRGNGANPLSHPCERGVTEFLSYIKKKVNFIKKYSKNTKGRDQNMFRNALNLVLNIFNN